MNITYKGTRWFKCDLHLHTPASECFQDMTVTPEQWVQRAIEQGLHCVAVTDHNSGNWIESIREAANGTTLTVFPGVEITCDTSKVHLLILFDVDKTTDTINDFIVRCEIDRKMFAKQLASTSLSIFEVAKKAHEHGAIVIPAHVDEYNGLGAISNDNLRAFYELPYINAVQVVHDKFTDKTLQTNNNEELKSYLNEYYNNPSPLLDFTTIADWHRPVLKAIENELALLTFSDNPHEPKNSKHGLWGIGQHYTWIKMDESPTLEGIRQAFLLPNFRVKNQFVCPHAPYKLPELWIKSISVSNSSITDGEKALKVDFSPQLTTIIGGRGSGKSSILRFVRGVFNRTADLKDLSEIIKDHDDFYRIFDPKSKKGALTDSCTIEIEFVRNGITHKIIASCIKNSTNQVVQIYRLEGQTGTWVKEDAEGYIDFFLYEQYSQKQIYEIAQEPNSLRDRIDRSIPELDTLKDAREVSKKLFLEKSASIRAIQQQITSKGKLLTRIADLEERIKLVHQSGIASLLTAKEEFTAQEKVLQNFVDDAISKETLIDDLIKAVSLAAINYTKFDSAYSDELESKSKVVVEGYQKIKVGLENLKQDAERLRTVFESSLSSTKWKSDLDENQQAFDAKKLELESNGVDDIANFEKLTQEKSEKEKELGEIIEIEGRLATESLERSALYEDYLQKTKDITSKRKSFIADLMQDDKVKVSINAFRNRNDFISKLRAIIQREERFQEDIEALTEICFTGNVEQKIKTVKEIFHKIRNNEQVNGISGHFANLVKGMTEAQIDEIELLFPEDEIDIKYKPSGSTQFKPLSTASAGQKTTAILTFILQQGNIPLILDQPEDDLDNRLVYELIVDRLKQAKEHRQIIVVTHNANIPVNGDAEYIVSMNSESKKLNILYSGTVEHPNIKKEICDVMEGSKQAFDMRSMRYKQLVS